MYVIIYKIGGGTLNIMKFININVGEDISGLEEGRRYIREENMGI